MSVSVGDDPRTLDRPSSRQTGRYLSRIEGDALIGLLTGRRYLRAMCPFPPDQAAMDINTGHQVLAMQVLWCGGDAARLHIDYLHYCIPCSASPHALRVWTGFCWLLLAWTGSFQGLKWPPAALSSPPGPPELRYNAPCWPRARVPWRPCEPVALSREPPTHKHS